MVSLIGKVTNYVGVMAMEKPLWVASNQLLVAASEITGHSRLTETPNFGIGSESFAPKRERNGLSAARRSFGHQFGMAQAMRKQLMAGSSITGLAS